MSLKALAKSLTAFLIVPTSSATFTSAAEVVSLFSVTLTLNKETTSAAEVKVALDVGTIKKAVSDFAKAFSDMNTYISQQTKYDATTKKAAPLQGDRPALAVQSSLRRLFTDSSTASSVYAR